MRPLPRLHAITDALVLAHPDLGIRAAAIAAAGSAVAIHVRDRAASGAALAATAHRIATLTRPPGAALFVSARPDLAATIAADGLQLGRADLLPHDARLVYPRGWIGCSVHSEDEARRAVEAGADYLLVGTIYPSPSHPEMPGRGLDAVRTAASLGRPVIAIGGMDPARAAAAREAGAYGVAAISALWHAADPAAATLAMLEPWMASA